MKNKKYIPEIVDRTDPPKSIRLGKLRKRMIKKIVTKKKKEDKKYNDHRFILDAIDGVIAMEVNRWQDHATNNSRK